MQRGLAALACASLLVVIVPGSAAAARVTRFSDHVVAISCEGPVDGGYISTYTESSDEFGGFSTIDLWLDPAVPFEDPSTATGVADAFDLTEAASGVDLAVSWTVNDADGNPLGSASLAASLSPVGDPYTDPPFPTGNHHSTTVVTHQDLAGSATITVLEVGYAVDCSGTISDLDVFESNPTAFVSGNEGVQLDCLWEDGDTAAGFFAVNDEFGLFASPFLVSASGGEFGGEFTGSFDATSMDLTIQMADDLGNPIGAATASSTFEPVGDLITAFLTQQHIRTKLVVQNLAADGSIEFPTGESFPFDAEHCTIQAFINHVVVAAPKGPKPGSPPVNDTPDGAIAVTVGSTVRAVTTGTAVDPEVGLSTCPQGISDDFGHTVWYTFQGTGDPVTLDTTGSNFDTLVGVYTLDGETWTEVGCADDQGNAQYPISLQAVLTVPTEAGVTYYVEAGGFRRFFDPENAQAGRLRLSID